MNISIFPLSLFNDMTNGPLECNITSAGDVPGGCLGNLVPHLLPTTNYLESHIHMTHSTQPYIPQMCYTHKPLCDPVEDF